MLVSITNIEPSILVSISPFSLFAFLSDADLLVDPAFAAFTIFFERATTDL